ncbi:uncharacterized protein LOC122025337 [Zingiber officinale]|uniref:uncharacterized protein LOC122025337 n=1 Tax=Zingiber officinale TaxID=94328 RepID=UPI001C4AE10D|nr:uncharacterized protein LOC122025337 [Zingiber officinale]
MEEMVKRCQVPAFGHWNWSFYDEDIPISQYFESRLFGGDHGGDLFKVLSPCKDQKKQEGKMMKSVKEKKIGRKDDAVDEDLYKIPPEILYQMPKKKKRWNFCSVLLCLSCIA